MIFSVRVPAAFAVVMWLSILRVSLKMNRKAVVAQPFTGQDQMLGFLPDASNTARSRLTPHRDKSERLPTDAQVVLVPLPAFVGAHRVHPLQVLGIEEGLRGSATAGFVHDVVLPLGLVERSGSAGGNVPLDEGVVAFGRSGALAGSIVLGQSLMSQQEADGKSEKGSESSHVPGFLQ